MWASSTELAYSSVLRHLVQWTAGGSTYSPFEVSHISTLPDNAELNSKHLSCKWQFIAFALVNVEGCSNLAVVNFRLTKWIYVVYVMILDLSKLSKVVHRLQLSIPSSMIQRCTLVTILWKRMEGHWRNTHSRNLCTVYLSHLSIGYWVKNQMK